MKTQLLIFFIIIRLLKISLAQVQPYLGQTPPGIIPEIFAPEIISLPETHEWSLTFSFDSSEVFFYRIGDSSFCKLYYCKFEDSSWTTPTEVSFSVAHSASEPCFTIDNQKLYFIWADGLSQLPNYYYVERIESGWSSPHLAGQGMWLCTDGDGQLYTTDLSSLLSTGKSYLAKVQTNNGVFSGYERMIFQPYYGYQAHPCIAQDKSFMIFDVNGGSDLYVSFKKPDGNWATGIRLADHGFSANAGGAYLSPCGKYLFFHLNQDIYWVNTNAIKALNPYTGTRKIISENVKENFCFPNITSDKLKLKTLTENKAMLLINNLSGQIIETHEIINSITEIDLSNFPDGLYIFRLINENKIYTERVFKY